jgi:hypothetical protein
MRTLAPDSGFFPSASSTRPETKPVLVCAWIVDGAQSTQTVSNKSKIRIILMFEPPDVFK